MTTRAADQNRGHSFKNSLYSITAQPAFDFPCSGRLLGRLNEKDCPSPGLEPRPYCRSLEPFHHLDAPTDQRTSHAPSPLEPTPPRRGRQGAATRLIRRIAPFQPLDCPALGIGRQLA